MRAASPQPVTTGPVATGIDQRVAPRTRTMFVIGRIVTAQRERICLVRNISSSGIGVEQTGELPIESEVLIETRTMMPTRAIVRWSTAIAAGLEFLEPPRKMMQTAQLIRPNRVLRSPRFSFVCPVVLRVGDLAIQTRTIDIALGGLKLLDVDAHLPVDPARIALPGAGTLHGRVRWNNMGSTGFQFAAPLTQQCLATLLDQPRDANQ